MKPNRTLFVAAILLLLAACGSTPPSNFYRLNPQVTQIPDHQDPTIGIGPVTIPEYLNRTEIVLANDDNRLQMQDYDRWAERMDEGITRVVAINVASLVNTNRVYAIGILVVRLASDEAIVVVG